MKPKKYPYSGRPKLIRKELPRFVRLGNIAFNSELVKHIEVIREVSPKQTLVCFKIPKLFTVEEHQVRVHLRIDEAVKILNQE